MKWKPLPGLFPYEASECGQIRGVISGEIVHQGLNNDGYMYCTLFLQNGIKKKRAVSRLVAAAWVENPLGLKQVNHIDGDKLNNHSSNLEWTTNQKNMQHAYDNGLIKRSKTKLPVCRIENGEVLEVYANASIAGRKGGFNYRKILRCCKGEAATHKGYEWCYLTDVKQLSN